MVLLLGCGGLVGTHTAVKLLSAGYNVRIFMLETASTAQIEALQTHTRGPGRLFVFRGDQLDRAIEDCHYVVIAQLPRRPNKYSRALMRTASGQEQITHDCVADLQDLFLCAKKYGRKLKRIVLISSAAAAFPVIEPVQQDVLHPKARQRLLREVQRLAARSRISLVSLLPSVVLGKAMCCGALGCELSDWHYQLLRIGRSWLPFVPKLRYNMVDVEDVALAAVAVLESTAAEGQRYLISNKEMSLREITAVMSGTSKWELPNAVTLVLSTTGLLDSFISTTGFDAFRYLRRNLDREFPLSSEKYSRDLGFHMSDLEPAIRKTAASVEAAQRDEPSRSDGHGDAMQLDADMEYQVQRPRSSLSIVWGLATHAGIVLTTALAAMTVGRQLLGSRSAALAVRPVVR